MTSKQDKIKAPNMTPREIEAFYLIGEGYSIPEVGEELGISARTAKLYSDTLRAKWGVQRKRELIALAQAFDRGEFR